LVTPSYVQVNALVTAAFPFPPYIEAFGLLEYGYIPSKVILIFKGLIFTSGFNIYHPSYFLKTFIDEK